MRRSGLLLVFVLTATGCRQGGDPTEQSSPVSSNARVEDLATARKGFVTRLVVRGPAPQEYSEMEPFAGAKVVTYQSGDLNLKGWLSTGANEGGKRPAVVFLHGGMSFGEGDWEDAEPFAQAGFVLFMPMLRGENANPGVYESFLGETDDAIAAGKYVSSLPNVDSNRVFLTGHSVGAVLTCLASMLPSPYKAAAALDGYVDMESWVARSSEELVPYDRHSPDEIRVRNPMAHASSLRCPLRLYAGDFARDYNLALATRARQAGKDCEAIIVQGDHHEMVAPSVQQVIAWFRQSSPE